MENINILTPFLSVLCYFSLQLSSSAYTLPSQFFINCGSLYDIDYLGRTFTRDSNTNKSLSFTLTGRSTVVEYTGGSTETPVLYQTARLFKRKSSYELMIKTSGTYFVRFHFFAFTSSHNIDLSSAVFDVSVSGFSLLSNFSVPNSNRRENSVLIKEFFISVKTGKFVIWFLPVGSSCAFVNAIEVFVAPDNFIPDEAGHITPNGSTTHFQGILSKAWRTVHRVNVGGPKLTPDNDTLWRTWVPDDAFIYMPDSAKKTVKLESELPYPTEVDEYSAPDIVYQTAKEMNIDSSSENNFNVTWTFRVDKNSRYFVRVHFCDIVSSSLGVLKFHLYVFSHFSHEIVPYQICQVLAAPFFIDFVVDSDHSGLVNVSIGNRKESQEKHAFLNGVEIMEMVEESGLTLKTHEPKWMPISVIVGLSVGGLAFISISAVVICLCLKGRKPKKDENSEWSPYPVHRAGSSQPDGTVVSCRAPDLNIELKISFAEILFATNNFDAKKIVGKGGFGHVYRGILKDGTKVAVKRGEPGSGQGLSEFINEITVLSRIRHQHLVSLIGYCDEMSEMILVYEFMEKGTLKDHLYDSSLPPLSWRHRLEICIGAAKGLHYLHQGSSSRFIHRDVKSTNILLDVDLVAKIADFGLARVRSLDETHVSTGVKGTFGYLDPDYFRTQQLREESDVYSFGVVLLEVLCGRAALNISLPSDQVNLAEWGVLCKKNGTLEHVVDPSVKDQINPNSLRKFSEVAVKCLQEDGSERPSMADVQWDLEYALQLQQTPMPIQPHDASCSSVLPDVPSIPSSMLIEKDDMPILVDHNWSVQPGSSPGPT